MIHWDKVYRLKAGEFSEDPNKYAEPQLIYSLGTIRKFTQKIMRPSPVRGALARFTNGKSQHCVGPENAIIRKSTASDIFCEGIPFYIYSSILSSNLFKGIGIYLDTKGPDGLPWVMFHVDIREKGFSEISPLIWIVERVHDFVRDKMIDKYRYPQVEPQYWDLFNDKRIYRNKKYGS